MLSMINEIKKEMEQELIGINLNQITGRIELHYTRGTFKNKFQDYKFVPRESSNETYQYDAVADLGDGIIAFCLVTEEMKKQWEAELDARRNDSTSCERSAS